MDPRQDLQCVFPASAQKSSARDGKSHGFQDRAERAAGTERSQREWEKGSGGCGTTSGLGCCCRRL